MKFHTSKFLILLVLVNLCASVGYYLLFDNTRKETEKASTLSSKIDLGSQRSGRLSGLQSAVKETESERAQLTSFFLPTGSEVSFIEQVESLAKASGLSEKTSNVSEVPGRVGGTKIVQVQIMVTGSWSNVIYFLGQLENSPYKLDIRNISLLEQSSGSKKTPSTWAGSFDINVVEII